jgi:hypothetical protein
MQRIDIVSDLSRRLPFWVVFDRRLLELGCAAEYVDIRAGQQAIRQSARPHRRVITAARAGEVIG